MVSEGSECACLAPWTWEEHHGSRNTCEVVTSWQKGSKERGDWEWGVTLKSLLLERVPSFIYIPLTKTEALYRNRAWEEHFIPKPWLWSFDALVFGDNKKLQMPRFQASQWLVLRSSRIPAGPLSLCLLRVLLTLLLLFWLKEGQNW